MQPRTHNQVRNYNSAPKKQFPKKILYIFAALIVGVILLQLVWPSNRARPFTHVAGISAGGASTAQLAEKLTLLQSTSALKVTLHEKTFEDFFINTGIELQAQKTAESATAYPLWQRLIPLSIISNALRQTTIVTEIDNNTLQKKAADWAAQAKADPVNATVKIENNTAQISAEKNGAVFNADEVAKQLAAQKPSVQTVTVTFTGETLKPVRGTKQVKDAYNQATNALTKELNLIVNNTAVTPTPTQIAQWLNFSESADKKTYTLDINGDALQTYVYPFEKSIYKAPGTTFITYVDNTEKARTTGAKGYGVNISDASTKLKAQFKKPKTDPVTLSPVSLEPQEVKSFANSSSELTALLAKIGKAKGDVAITVQELSGKQRVASYRGSTLYHPASTYKLFVAYSVLKRIDNGSLKWGGVYYNGYTVEQCFTKMIVNSDNACSEAFGEKIGWQTIQNELRAIGLPTTVLVSGGGFRSDTNEQVAFLNRLLNANIVTQASKDKLLTVMKRQEYRLGVPSGVTVPVADKVGFLEGLLHDTAIVYGKNGTYLLSVYTDNSSWANIADITRQINAYLNQ